MAQQMLNYNPRSKQKKEKYSGSDYTDLKPEDLGSGYAEKAATAAQERNKKLREIDEELFGPQPKKKK